MARNYEPMGNGFESEVCGSAACERQSCKICSAQHAQEQNETFDRAHLARLVISGVLFLIGAIFHDQLHATPYSWAEYVVLVPAYLLVGFPVLKEAFFDVVHGRVFNEMFLMSVATLGAFAIHQVPEAVGVMLFYSVGEYLQDMAVDKSRRSISELMDLRPDFARLYEAGQTREVAPESVRIGDKVEVRPGERFPLDGKVVEGESFVDTSSLTGESVPRRVAPGSDVLAGYINDNGRVVVRVGAEFGDSAVSRILDLVEHASANKAPTEKFLSKFAAVYTPIVVALAAFIAFVPPLVVPGATFSEFVYRALVLLVISCPCALVVSVPLGYFAGIGNASKNRILVKGANYLDALTKLDTVAFDKTGTLTKGVFSVTDVVPYNGFSREEVLRYAAAAEYGSTHPIARSIRQAAAALPVQSASASIPRIENPSEKKGYGVHALVDGHDVMAGNDRMLHGEQIPHDNCNPGGTVVHVVVDGHYAGYILISDIVKDGAAQAVRELKSEGVRKAVMLSGDDEAVATKIASGLGIDDCYAELLPQEKVEKLQQIKRETPKGKGVAFVGDGMNDAPVLMSADVGLAMGGLGSDAAIEAADLVIMDDDIHRIPLAIRIAKHTHTIVSENVAFALSIKGVFIILGVIGHAGMWQAVVADVGVSLLAVLNSLRAAGRRRESDKLA
ncbi:MAG TPA: heavy metal translocating P-type ATPase [Spirochaetales bacterium]|nr:heavy metal translocating P-type ATPase [Spirochaetales bacterium]